jgi:uncharacterized RDD family membrane protein YckC
MLTEKPTPSLPTNAPREETHRWRAIWHWLMRLTLSSVLLAGLALIIWVALFINALREGLGRASASISKPAASSLLSS